MWRARRLHSQFIPNIQPLRTLGRWISRLSPLDLASLSKRPFSHISKWEEVDREARGIFAVDGAQRFIRTEALFRKLRDIHPIEERAFLARSFEDFYIHLRTLLACNDKMGMSQSIEARVPFLETNLIDFGLHLPCRAKYFRGVTKRIVKAAAEKRLPHDIVHAPKIGFGVSHHAWRYTGDFLKGGMVADLFKWGKRENLEISNLLLKDPSSLFHLMCMELWARIYFRSESPVALGEKLLEMNRARGKTKTESLSKSTLLGETA